MFIQQLTLSWGRAPAALAASLICLALAGCGGDGSQATTAAEPPPAAAVVDGQASAPVPLQTVSQPQDCADATGKDIATVDLNSARDCAP